MIKNKIEHVAPEELSVEEFSELPLASYPEIDRFMHRANDFVETTKHYRQISSVVVTAVAEYIAASEGKRIR